MDPGKKNIVILIGKLVTGGAEKQSLLLAKALSGEYHVRYVVLKAFKIDLSYLQDLRESGLDHEILKGTLISRMVRLISLLRSFRTDLLFCYLPGDNMAGAVAGKLAGVKQIIGGVRNTKIVKRKFYLLRFVQNHMQDRVIFNSTRAMEVFCSKGYRREKALVIENAFAERMDFFERPDQEAVTILMVGRFVRQKDYLTGIRAVAGLGDLVTNRRIRLVVAGYGPMERQIQDWILEHGLDELTEIIVQPGNLPELYHKCDIYLNSSVHEGFSNAVMEAMGHGLPVVATRSGDIDKQVTHGKSGYITPVGDSGALSEGLELLCRDNAARIEFGKEGHRRLYKSFGLEPFKAKYIRLIQSLS